MSPISTSSGCSIEKAIARATASGGISNRFDVLLDTVSATHPLTPYVQSLRLDGTLCSVGLPDAFDVSPFALAR